MGDEPPATPESAAGPGSDPRLAPATLAVSRGRPHDPGDPASVPPVLSSSFRAGGPTEYTRTGNPTWSALEDVLSALEGPGVTALSFGSGMGAVAAAVELAPMGGNVVVAQVAYSGTRALLLELATRGRVRVREVAMDLESLAAAAPGADLVWLESPANPTLDIIDITAAADIARNAGALVAVDATFATPLGFHPLDLGADVVIHSATKYLSGHSDVLLGAALTRDPDLAARMLTTRTLVGAIPGPMEAWLALRGLRTFPLRFERACANACVIAARALGHPALSRVRHLSLPTDPGYELARRQLAYPGAIVSLELAGGVSAAENLVAATRLWTHATSLGGVESTLERRRRWSQESPAVPENLVRLSVGIEDVEDLWADLEQALARV